jgi:hypothetical protein
VQQAIMEQQQQQQRQQRVDMHREQGCIRVVLLVAVVLVAVVVCTSALRCSLLLTSH